VTAAELQKLLDFIRHEVIKGYSVSLQNSEARELLKLIEQGRAHETISAGDLAHPERAGSDNGH
jgi:hypothetical protein